jgi:hypothetical protein
MSAERTKAGADLIQKIQAAEDTAMRAGFPITSRALNQAKNTIGWELANNIAAADRARMGKRAGEG